MRQKLEYKEKVNIPEQFRSLFWDYPELPASVVSAIQTMQKNWLSL